MAPVLDPNPPAPRSVNEELPEEVKVNEDVQETIDPELEETTVDEDEDN